MRAFIIALAAALLAGCPAPAKPPQQFVTCFSPNANPVQTQPLDFWVYEDGGWSGYRYPDGLSVSVERVSVYAPLPGSVCTVQGVR